MYFLQISFIIERSVMVSERCVLLWKVCDTVKGMSHCDV